MGNLFRLAGLLFLGVPVALASPAWAQSASDECGRSPIEYADEEGLTAEEKIRRMDLALTRSLNRFDECQTHEEDKLEPETEDSAAQSSESESGGGAESESQAESESESESAESEGLESREGESASTAPGDISGDEADPSATQNPSASSSPPPGSAGSASAGGIAGEGEGELPTPGSPSVAAGDIAGDEPDPVSPQASGSGARAEQNPGAGGQAGAAGTVAGNGSRVLNNGKLPEDIPSADNDSVLEAQIRQAAIDEPDPELKKKLWNEYRRYKGLPQVK